LLKIKPTLYTAFSVLLLFSQLSSASPFDDFKSALDQLPTEQEKLHFVNEMTPKTTNWSINDQGQFHHQKGLVLEINDQIEAAKSAFTESIQIFETADKPNGYWVKSLLDRSYMDYLLTNNTDVYCVDRQSAVEIARESEEADALTGALVQLAFCHQLGFESFKTGLSLLDEAATIAQKHELAGDMSAMIYNATGNLYRSNQIHDKAYDYYLKAYNHWDELKDYQDMFNMQHNMVGESIKLGLWEQAKSHVDTLFSMAEQHPEFSDFRFFAHYNQAMLGFKQNQFAATAQQVNMALELAHTTPEQYFVRALKGIQVIAYFRDGQLKVAGKLADEFLKQDSDEETQQELRRKVELISQYMNDNHQTAINDLWLLLDDSEAKKQSFIKNAVALQALTFDQKIDQFQEQALGNKLTISQLELEKRTKQNKINQLTGVAAVLLAGISFVFSWYLYKSRQFYLHSSRTDFLTQSHNRRRIFELGQTLLGQLNKLRQPFSVAILDIDDFKHINDQFGHDLGDQVLVQLVSTVKGLLLDKQQLGRMGGEEFLLLFPNTSATEAKQYAEKIRQAMAEITMIHQGSSVKFSVSIGVFATENNHTMSFENMIKQADLALYEAKKSGKNQAVLQVS